MTANLQNIPGELRACPQWVVWRYEHRDGTDKPTKVPYDPNSGRKASVADPTTWATVEDAGSALQSGGWDGVGFVFSENDPFAGVDLDVPEGGLPKEFQRHTLGMLDSYAEYSPSGRGLHIIVKGAVPAGRNNSDIGIEVYSSRHFFTFTGKVFGEAKAIAERNGLLNELWTEIGGNQDTQSGEVHDPSPAPQLSDDELVSRIRQGDANRRNYEGTSDANWSDAYFALICAACLFSSDEAQVRRVVMASPLVQHAMPKGRETRQEKAERLWAREYPRAAQRGAVERQERALGVDHGRQVARALFGKGQTQGDEPAFNMTFVTGNERAVQMEHLIDPWLPKRNVVGLFGRGEAGKSTWAASLSAHASAQVSTLWVSSEEDTNHVALRFTHSGGEPNTLITLTANPVKYDKQTGKAVATTFDVYAHLETAIADYRKVPGYRTDRPLGIVVLDAINALVAWGKGENANDDASVKRMLSHLHTLAMNYDLSIVILGHMNKNTNKEHGADAVTGSAAWTNSLRRAFMFYKDVASDDYEGFVRTAKGNTGTAFAASYKTVPVYTLLKRAGGMDEVLCRVELTSDIVWGERSIAKLLNDSDDEDPTRDRRHKREERMKMYATHVATVIRQGATTREAINAALPKEVGTIYPKYWAKVDALLGETYGIDVVTVSHGKYEYKVRNPNAAGTGIPQRPYTL